MYGPIDVISHLLQCPIVNDIWKYMSTYCSKNYTHIDTRSFYFKGIGTEWHTFEGLLHSYNDNPALIDYQGDKINLEIWCRNGVITRNGDKPAVKSYYPNGKIKMEDWIIKGKYYRIGAPASIDYYSDESIKAYHWMINNLYGRENKPAFKKYYKNGNIKKCEWIVNGKHHREGDPAILNYYDNGNIKEERWKSEGRSHRDEYPAIIKYYENGEVAKDIWIHHNIEHKKQKYPQ